MTAVAHFDDDGVCRLITTGSGEPPSFAHSAEVPQGTALNEIWFDATDGTVKASVPTEVALPDNPLEPFTINLAPGVVAEVAGVRHTGSVTVDHTANASITLSGAAHGSVTYHDYAERRLEAYPSMGDQLDALWKAIDPPAGSDAAMMKDKVMAVKTSIPKPVLPTK